MTTALCHALPELYKELNGWILRKRIRKSTEISTRNIFGDTIQTSGYEVA
jgi:hypothetical protein